MSKVIVVVGTGLIGQAIARRVGVGGRVVLADVRRENAELAAETLSNAGLIVGIGGGADGVEAQPNASVTNLAGGTISAGNAGVAFYKAAGTLSNAGLITGWRPIRLGDGSKFAASPSTCSD